MYTIILSMTEEKYNSTKLKDFLIGVPAGIKIHKWNKYLAKDSQNNFPFRYEHVPRKDAVKMVTFIKSKGDFFIYTIIKEDDND